MLPNDISVVILTYNRPQILKLNLECIASSRDAIKEVIVVDNSSDDLSKIMVKDFFPWVNLITNKTNTGVAGRNLGIQKAIGEVVVTLDDDVTGLTPSDFQLIFKNFSEQPQLGGLCFRVLHAQTGEICNWCHHRDHEKDGQGQFLTYEITEGAVAFRREALKKSGSYYPKYFISHEGKDLAFRIMNAGYVVAFDGQISVEHSFSSSGRVHWRRYYYDTRNAIWLAVRHMPFWYATRFLGISLSMMFFYSLRDGFLKYWFRAVRDGVSDIKEINEGRDSWSPETKNLIDEIDRQKPPFWYKLKMRIFRRGIQI